MLAEKFRRRAHEMTLVNYVRLMERAAADLDAEAAMLDETQPVEPGRRLNISV